MGSTALALTGPEFSFGSGLPSFAELYPGGSATRCLPVTGLVKDRICEFMQLAPPSAPLPLSWHTAALSALLAHLCEMRLAGRVKATAREGVLCRARLSGLTPLDSWLTSAGLGPSPLSSLLSSWPRGAASGASQRRLAQSTPLEVPWPPQAALQQQADKSTAEQLQQLAHQTQQQTEASA